MVEGSQSNPLDYSSLPPDRPRPRWTGVVVVAAVAGGGISLLVSTIYRSVGLFPAERMAVYAVLIASAVCIIVGFGRLRGERDSLRPGVWRAYIGASALAVILDVLAAWACMTAHPL